MPVLKSKSIEGRLLNLINDCCGCSSCVDSCPTMAISMVKTPYGYKIPKVDSSVCIDCGKCAAACPVFHKETSEYEGRNVYAAYAKDAQQRMGGSSGSVFFSLGKSIIEQKGVVFGAAFDDDLQLKHRGVASVADLYPLMKSKYLQSEMVGIYNQVKSILGEGKPVLFVGTPCQCNAMYKTIKDRRDLYLVDFICHGVPNQDFFDKSIASYEKKNKCVVKEFTFRYKHANSGKYFKLVYDKEGEAHNVIAPCWKFPFYNIFYLYASLRKSCYHCPFVGEDRVSDLTISDFWGLNVLDSSIKDMGKGYSMVITNSDKGERLIESVLDDLNYKKGFALQNAIDYNSSYTRPVKDGFLSHLFRWMYANFPFYFVVTIFPKFSYFKRIGQKVSFIKMKIKRLLRI